MPRSRCCCRQEALLPPTQGGAEPAPDDDDLPVAVVVAARVAPLLVLVGLVPLGWAIALATALGWAIGRHGSRPTAQGVGR